MVVMVRKDWQYYRSLGRMKFYHLNANIMLNKVLEDYKVIINDSAVTINEIIKSGTFDKTKLQTIYKNLTVIASRSMEE